MITLRNTTKSVKVLKALGMPTLRIIPGFNYIDATDEDIKKYAKTEVNKAMIKESIKFIDSDINLSSDEVAEAKAALATNEKLNKAQKVIDKQNKQILEKDKVADDQSSLIKEQGDIIAKLMARLDKLEAKKK